MVNEPPLDYNVEGRIERAPLGAISYILNIIGIVGNGVIIHIFRTRTAQASNYRIFVLFLSVVDLSLCISHIPKEMSRMISVYNQVAWGSDLICKVSHYLGNSVGMASLLIAFFISFERYRKICTPFKSQITTKQSKVMCLSVICIGFFIQFPVYLIHGKRYVQVENINATRCNVKNEYDGNVLTFLYYAFVFVAAFTCIILVVIFQVKIRNALVKKAITKRQMKSKAKELSTGEEQEECGIRTLDGKSVQKEKANQPESKRRATDSEEEKNRRIAITFAFVTVFLVASFVTITLFQTIQATKRYFYPRQQFSKMEDIFEEYLPDIVVINGILNPFVYFFTDTHFKVEAIKLCGRKV